ncbi:MDR family MFS transporter [Nocardioides aequoreus]|uniref:MDR family MFS transporter n=1 Tax=Nocardioides aequoreus TaxID=397278 RepID=UPI000A008EED|nr:MDR family MFS transporter [Nocardioides aequoreus]
MRAGDAQTTDLDGAAAEGSRDYGVLRWLVAATFVVILNETTMVNAIPALMADFDVDASAAQWLTTVFMLTMAVVIPTTGWLLQRLRTRQVFALAMVTFSVGTLAAALAPTFGVLLVARVVQASGTAVMLPLLMTTLMSIVHESDRGRVMGNVTLAISVAPALGPTVSGFVLQELSWRWIFVLVLPIAGVITAVGLRHLVDVGETGPHPLDLVSVALAAIGFGGLVYGLSELGEGAGGGTAYVAAAAGVVGVVVFVLRQRALARSGEPLLDLRTLRIPTYALSLAAMSLGFMSMLGAMILLPLHLQEQRGLSPLATGLLVMPGGIAMGLLGPRVGRLYDRLGPRPLVIPGAVGLLAASAGLALLLPYAATWGLLTLHVLLMVSLAGLFTPLFTMGLGALPPHLYSHGSSLLGTLQQVAGAVGTAAAISVMTARTAAVLQSGGSEHDAGVEGIRWAFGSGAVVGVVTLVVVLALVRHRRRAAEDRTGEPVAEAA